MDRKFFFMILLTVFCVIIFFWLYQTVIYIQDEIAMSNVYGLHGVCFASASAIFILMLIVLDIIRSDYVRENKELDNIKAEKKRILFEDWKRKRKMSLYKRIVIVFCGEDNLSDQGGKEDEIANQSNEEVM